MDRFDDRVDRSAGPGACWPWTGAREKPGGYGVFWFAGKNVKAHRHVYLWRGEWKRTAIPATTLDGARRFVPAGYRLSGFETVAEAADETLYTIGEVVEEWYEAPARADAGATPRVEHESLRVATLEGAPA